MNELTLYDAADAPAVEKDLRRVFVTHIPKRRNPATNELEPVIDIRHASAHGAVSVMIEGKVYAFASADLVAKLQRALRDYNFARGDSVLALGDPAICAVMGSVLALRHSAYCILKWDRMLKRYVRQEVNLRAAAAAA